MTEFLISDSNSDEILIGSVCAVPITRIDQISQKALESLFSIECSELQYFLLLDGVKISNEHLNADSWEKFWNFLCRQPRWLSGQVTIANSFQKRGLIAAWNTSAILACKLVGKPEFFFWGSDHDLWHPNFFKHSVVGLQTPGAALCLPTCVDIDENDNVIGFVPTNSGARRKFLGTYNPGYSIYGVFKISISSTPQLRNVLLPDRLLIAELTQRASVVEYKSTKPGYSRRRFPGENFSIQRQKKSLWSHTNFSRMYIIAPWWLVHLIFLSRKMLFKSKIQVNGRGMWFPYLAIGLLAEAKIGQGIKRAINSIRKS